MIRNTSSLDFAGIDKTNNPFRRYISYIAFNKIIGYISFDLIYNRIEIIKVFVLEEYRGRKIATNMLKYLIDEAKEKNYTNLTLEVDCLNKPALSLYKKFDFVIVTTKKDYYGAGKDAYYMELIL